MAYEPVDVFVLSSDLGKAPVEGTVVRVYSIDGKRRYGEAVTSALGKASFLLPAPDTYDLRFYKYATGFQQPQRIQVVTDPTIPNVFEVVAQLLDRPVATDRRLCRAGGLFRDVTGAPRGGLDIQFLGNFNPVLLEGALVMDERRSIRTDSTGYACIDLIRCAEYRVTIEAFEDTQRTIRVPDAASVNLPDLLFPVIARVVLSAPTLNVGEEAVITPVVYDSAGVPLPGTARYDVRWSVEDPAVASLTVNNDTLLLRGVAAGSTNLLAERSDSSIVRIPATPISGVPVVVTVT